MDYKCLYDFLFSLFNPQPATDTSIEICGLVYGPFLILSRRIATSLVIRKYQKKTDFYQFPHLAASSAVTHGIFTRHGGYSTGKFKGLNMSFDVGDVEENVLKNRTLVKAAMNMPGMFSVRQVHGNSVRIFSQPDKSDLEEHEGDALITGVPGYLLLVKGADCQSVVIFDPFRNVVANIHVGWRGSTQNIIGKTISVMEEAYGSRARDLISGIGPSLGPCCAEFVNHAQELPPAFKRYEVSLNYFDFWAISREQLEASGVCPGNIAVSAICTKCNSDQFFSYRKEKITGRFGTVIGLKI